MTHSQPDTFSFPPPTFYMLYWEIVHPHPCVLTLTVNQTEGQYCVTLEETSKKSIDMSLSVDDLQRNFLPDWNHSTHLGSLSLSLPPVCLLHVCLLLATCCLSVTCLLTCCLSAHLFTHCLSAQPFSATCLIKTEGFAVTKQYCWKGDGVDLGLSDIWCFIIVPYCHLVLTEQNKHTHTLFKYIGQSTHHPLLCRIQHHW